MQFQVYCNVYTLPSAVRYVEAVTPTLSKLHPSALIDGLHSQCLDRLKQQNKLKKLAEGDESIGSPTACAQRQSVSGEEGLDVAKTSSLQALFTLPRVSYQFSFLQNCKHNNNNKGNLYSAHLPYGVEAQGTFQ